MHYVRIQWVAHASGTVVSGMRRLVERVMGLLFALLGVRFSLFALLGVRFLLVGSGIVVLV